MARADLSHGTHFSQPVRQIVQMLAVLGLVGAGVWLIYPSVAPVFAANPWLNGVIIGVFLLGVIACFAQVLQLSGAVGWIERFADGAGASSRGRLGEEMADPPALLVPLAAMLRARRARGQISATSSRSILDSVGARMEEARDITRYIVNTLIFLGLLGTFWGLAITVPAVVDTIRSLEPADGESSVAVFGRLIGGLEEQLAGMGTAFASSLLGLAGSLVVGLLELFAGHGQNRFYRELEDWLSSITRVGLVGDGPEETIDQYSLAAVLDHMNYQMESLQEMFQRAEAGRLAADARVGAMADAIAQVARAQEGREADAEAIALLGRLAAGQDRIIEAIVGEREGTREGARALDRVAEAQENFARVLGGAGGEGGLDAESRMRIRSIDVQLLKILDELGRGRRDTVDELRDDLAALTHTMRQLNRLVQRSQEQYGPQEDGAPGGASGGYAARGYRAGE
jgi:hypothetical protein